MFVTKRISGPLLFSAVFVSTGCVTSILADQPNEAALVEGYVLRANEFCVASIDQCEDSDITLPNYVTISNYSCKQSGPNQSHCRFTVMAYGAEHKCNGIFMRTAGPPTGSDWYVKRKRPLRMLNGYELTCD